MDLPQEPKGWWERFRAGRIVLVDVGPVLAATVYALWGYYWTLSPAERQKTSPWNHVSGDVTFQVSLLLSAAMLSYTVVRQLQELRKLPSLMIMLKRAENTGIEATRAAVSFIQRAFGLRLTARLQEEHLEDTLGALQAIGFNLRSWENHLSEQQGGNSVLRDKKAVGVWLRYMQTYYFEEAFDLGRGELVTNGRNFCYLLLTTLDALLQKLSHGETLVYYAVTPVHPKDWYNWPHGIRPRAYFEEDFIGLFHRTLRDTVQHAADEHQRLEHGRFVLAAATDADVRLAPFGWPIDSFERMTDQVRDSMIVPVSVPLEAMESATCKYVRAMYGVYSFLAGRFPADKNLGRGGRRHIVPLFCTSWSPWALEDLFDAQVAAVRPEDKQQVNDVRKKVMQDWDLLAKNWTKVDVSWLVSCAEREHRRQFQEALQQLGTSANNCELCSDALRDVKDFQGKMSDRNTDIRRFVAATHRYDAMLSEHEPAAVVKEQDTLYDLVHSALRLRDTVYLDNRHDWQRLGTVFSSQLQSSAALSWVVGLGSGTMNEWHELGVRPEFHCFGIREDNGPVSWKLVLATDLDYPFEVTKIRIVEDGDLFKQYCSVLDELRRGNSFRKRRVDGQS